MKEYILLLLVGTAILAGCAATRVGQSEPPPAVSPARPTAPALAASAVSATPSADPDDPCKGIGARLTVVSPAVGRAGETITITVRLHNDGCGRLGIPTYGLYLAADRAEPLTDPARPGGAFDLSTVEPGETGVGSTQLRLLRPGQLTVSARASFEFMGGASGSMSWSGVPAEPVTLTILTAEGGPPPTARPTVVPPTPCPTPLPGASGPRSPTY